MRRTTILGSGALIALVVVCATLLSARARDADGRARLSSIRALPARDAVCAIVDFAEPAPAAPLAVDALVDAMRALDALVRPAPWDDAVDEEEPPPSRDVPLSEEPLVVEMDDEPYDVEPVEAFEIGPIENTRGRPIDMNPEPPLDPTLDRAIVRLGRCLERAIAAGVDDPRLAVARRRLARARLCGTRPSDRRLRLRPGVPIVSRTIAEPLEVRFHPLPVDRDAGPDVARVVDGEPSVPPVGVTRIERPDAPVALPSAGYYVLEVRSVRDGWRRLRRVVVSDLEVVAQCFPDSAVILACVAGQPRAGVTVSVDGKALGVTGDDGVFVARGSPLRHIDARLRDEGGTHLASVYGRSLRRSDSADETTAHLWIDRGAYRPGETVHGRLVVRRYEVRAQTSLPVPRPASGRVAIELRFPGEDPVVREVRLDSFGVAPFTIPVPIGAGLGYVGVRAKLGEGRRFTDLRVKPTEFSVASYVRPDLVLDVDWPTDVDGPIAVTATLPSGVPAAGMRGRLRYWAESQPRGHAFELDAHGRATVRVPNLQRVPVDRLESIRHVEVSVLAANGIRATDGRRYSPEPSYSRTRGRADGLRISVKPRVTAGTTVDAVVLGQPGERVLVTVARDAPFASRALTLDANGRAKASFAVDVAWWPRAAVVAESVAERRSAVDYFEIDDPGRRLAVRLVDAPARCAPGEAVEWVVEVRDATGAPARASVALRVVDDAFLAAVRDPLVSATEALRPRWRRVVEAVARSVPFGSAASAIDDLLVDGKIRPPSAVRWWDGGTVVGRAGGRGGMKRYGGQGGRTFRTDFRPLAHFDPGALTDEDGRATVRFRFPDDVTRWRVTLVAVDRGTGVGSHECTVETGLPVSARALVPRVLRVGDAVDVACRVDRAVGEAGEATLRVNAAGALATFATQSVVAAGARSTTRAVRVVGREAGQATLTLDVAAPDGTRLDAVRRTLPVLPNTITRHARTSATLVGSGRVAIPPGDGVVTVAVDETLDRVLARAADYVSTYPHGCAEQTCASMTPTVLALAASRARGRRSAHAGLSSAQYDRLDHGMRRLASMQAMDGGFMWWPDRDNEWNGSGYGREGSDPRMTAIVWQFLARVKTLGVDPVEWGIVISRFAAGRRFRSDEGIDAVGFRIADLALHPDADDARARAEALVPRAATFPVATTARLGVALARAGRTALAGTLLEGVVTRAESIEVAPDALPGDGATCMLAAALELALTVRPDDRELHARLAARLLGRFRDGRFDHTAGTAAALFALAEMRTREPVVEADPVRVRPDVAGAVAVPVTSGVTPTAIGPTRAQHVVVDGPAGRTLFVSVTRESTVDAATAQPVSGAWALERRIVRIRRAGRTIVVPRGQTPRLRVGDVFDVRFAVTCPQGARYALIDCPVPAHCEALPCGTYGGDSLYRCVVDDGHAKVPLPRVPGDRIVRTVRLLAVFPGQASFPPAHAFAMYGRDPGAWSAGGSLVVEPASSDE